MGRTFDAAEMRGFNADMLNSKLQGRLQLY
jgi:hypothetical protein